MIKANELRIGNYVLQSVYLNGRCNEVRTVTAIRSEGSLNVKVNYGNTMKSLPSEWFEPIHLTERWLINLGFAPLSESDHGVRISVNSADELCWSRHDEDLRYQTKGSGFTRNYGIKYVHQLQNLYFALTGKELEVKS